MASLLCAWFYLFLCLDAESTFVKKLTMNFGSLHSRLPRLPWLLHLGAFSVLNPAWNRNGYPLRLSSSSQLCLSPHLAAELMDASVVQDRDDLGVGLKSSSSKEEAPVSGVHIFSLF